MKNLNHVRAAADIVTNVLLELKELTVPDVSLDLLDELAERRIREAGGEPYNKGYKPDWSEIPYPSTICASVDFEVCHAPPGSRVLKEGQVVKYDLGVRYKDGCGDAALTVAVGKIDNRRERAMRYGLNALYEGIKVVRAGIPISSIGNAIQRYAGLRGYEVVKEFTGHHIGQKMHEDPKIPHVYQPEYDKILLKEGDVICIEPIITPGNGFVKLFKGDGWTFYSPDREPSVMFEHMVLVTVDGCEILTHHVVV